MKIGIDIQASMGNKTGLGIYVQNLIDALSCVSSNHQFVSLKPRTNFHLNTPRRLMWENFEREQMIRKQPLDLLHIPAFAPAWRKPPCRLVVTLGDIIGVLFPNQKGWPSCFYWKYWLPAMCRKADHLLTFSDYSKKDIVQHLKYPEEKITTVYLSGHEGFTPSKDSAQGRLFKQRYGIRDKYFLQVGTLEPRKNMLRVLQAFKQFLSRKTSSASYQMILVGGTDFAHGKVFETLCAQTDLHASDFTCTGYLSQEDLNTAYQHADAFLFPSLYEGFGIPVLEAMACGTPVITSKTSSLPEVAGDAAILVDPMQTHEITEAMEQLANHSNLRNALIQKGFQQIRRFSWAQTAEQTLKIYESLQ